MERTARLGLGLAAALWALAVAGCAECEADFDCPGAEVCRSGACESIRCRSDRECPPAQRCADNRCREQTPEAAPTAAEPVSIGPSGPRPTPIRDAGGPDARVVDAGVGLDVGREEAGRDAAADDGLPGAG